ncbi:hypothetical protein [Actinomadura sp. WMMB 499]|uniref:hypothetical protein n=1 Tax=Actinomadura sp. WMMB 499 TaxID=1219491 RepID=UPI001248EB55|nr:hypothetical protein [Actinomadura sp. WMMB 499]QFG25425.1 hypothetical protein F7P10_33975 [Actinomadura sp. WMMB 499]
MDKSTPTDQWIVKDRNDRELAVVYGETFGEAVDAAIEETGFMGGFYVRRLRVSEIEERQK